MNNGMPNMMSMPGMSSMPGMPGMNMNGGNMAFVPGMGMPGDSMGGMGGHNCNCMDEIRAINNRIDAVERQIKRIERKLEPHVMPMPYGNTGNSSNQMANEYPQYQSGNYMI